MIRKYNNWLITGDMDTGKTDIIISELKDLIKKELSNFIIVENDNYIYDNLQSIFNEHNYKIITIRPFLFKNKLQVHDLLNEKGLDTKTLNEKYVVFIKNDTKKQTHMTEDIINYFSKISDYNKEVNNKRDMYFVLDQANRLYIENIINDIKGFRFHNKKHFILSMLSINQLFEMGLNNPEKLSIFDKQTHLTKRIGD